MRRPRLCCLYHTALLRAPCAPSLRPASSASCDPQIRRSKALNGGAVQSAAEDDSDSLSDGDDESQDLRSGLPFSCLACVHLCAPEITSTPTRSAMHPHPPSQVPKCYNRHHLHVEGRRRPRVRAHVHRGSASRPPWPGAPESTQLRCGGPAARTKVRCAPKPMPCQAPLSVRLTWRRTNDICLVTSSCGSAQWKCQVFRCLVLFSMPPCFLLTPPLC